MPHAVNEISPLPSDLQPLLPLPHSLTFLVMSATRGRSQMPLKLGLPSASRGIAADCAFAAADWATAAPGANARTEAKMAGVAIEVRKRMVMLNSPLLRACEWRALRSLFSGLAGVNRAVGDRGQIQNFLSVRGKDEAPLDRR